MSFIQNIVGYTKKSSLPKLGKSFTYNMYVEISDQGEHAFSQVLRPMPGYEKIYDVTGEPQGMFKVSRGPEGVPCIYGIWGKGVYCITTTACTKIADVAGSGKCSFAETSGYGNSHPHLVICDGVSVYAVDTTLTLQQQANDFRRILLPLVYPDSEADRITPAWIAYLYGYLVVGAANTDIFYTSYQYPFEKAVEGTTEIDYDVFMASTDNQETGGYGVWTMSEWQPDNTIIGCANGSRLFTLGERSFQVFTYQSSITNPFTSPDTASKNIGIKNKDSLAMFGDYIYWLGSSDMGDNTIYMMGADANPQRISTNEIEEQIKHFGKNTLKAFCMKWKSHTFYVLTFLSNDTTIAYDVNNGGWINLGSKKQNGQEGCYRYCNPIVNNDGDLYIQCSGALVEAKEPEKIGQLWSGNWFEHDNTPILRKRVGGMITVDHRPFKVGSIKLITNNGDYPLIPGVDVEVTMNYSSDGSTWNNQSTYSMGCSGDYGYDTIFRGLGKVTYLTIELSCASDVGFALYGIDVKGVSCGR